MKNKLFLFFVLVFLSIPLESFGRTWTFNDIRVEDYLIIDGSDPYIVFNNIDIAKDDLKAVYFKLSADFNTQRILGSVYWSSDEHPFKNDYRVDFIIDENVSEYIIPLNRVYLESGLIRSLRLDFEASSGKIKILDIKIISNNEYNRDLVSYPLQDRSILSEFLLRIGDDPLFIVIYLISILSVIYLLFRGARNGV